MSHLLQNHPGLVAIFVLIALAFLAVVLAMAFGWARQRAERLEHMQRSVNAIRWPGSNPAPHQRKPVPPPNPPRRTARAEMRSRAR
jgi:HAMP domain-containing protein